MLCTAITAAGLESGQHAVLTRGDLLDVGVANYAQADEIAGGREFGRRTCDFGGGAGERFQRRRFARPERRRETGVDDPAGHRGALATEANESDVHQPASTSVCMLDV